MEVNQRKDAEVQRRKEIEREFLAPSRPGGFALNESLVEQLASDQFKIISAPIKRGVEIGDTGTHECIVGRAS